MKFSDWMIGILLVFLVFTAFGGFFIHHADTSHYNITLSETFQGTYTNSSDLAEYIEDTTSVGLEMTNESMVAKQIEGDYVDPSKSQLRSVKMVWDGFGIVKNLVYDASAKLKIPPYIVSIVIGVIIFSLLFAFISLIFRWAT